MTFSRRSSGAPQQGEIIRASKPMKGERSSRVARAASAVAILLGAGVLLGWVLDVAALKRVLPGLVTMKVNTAASLVLAAVSLLLQIEPHSARWPLRVARACALVVVAVSTMTLAEHIFRIDFGIDQFLFPLGVPSDEMGTATPGRMAPNTGFGLALLGAALLLLDTSNRTLRAGTQALAVIVLLTAAAAGAGYAFAVAELYVVAGYSAMALHTAAGLAILSVGVLASRPRARLLRFLDWPLRAKMAALLIVASATPLAIAAFADIQATAKRLHQTTESLLGARADQLVSELEGFNRGHRRSVDYLARAVATLGCCRDLEESRSQAVRAILATRPAGDPDVLAAAILDLDGRVLLAADPRMEGLDLSYHGYMRERSRGVPVVSDVHVAGAEASGQPVLAYLAPVHRSAATSDGLAVVWVRATSLWTLMRRYNGLAGPRSFAVLFDQYGIRIAHTYNDAIVFHPGGSLKGDVVGAAVAEGRFGQRTKMLLEDVRAFPEQFTRAVADAPDAGIFRGFAPVNLEWNYGVGRRLETARWTVFYMLPEETLGVQIARSTQAKTLVATIIIALALLAGAAFATLIVRPIRSLSHATQRLALGEPNVRVEKGGADEIGELAESFNRMGERIEAQAATLRQSNQQLEQRVRERTADLVESEQQLRVLNAELELRVDSRTSALGAALKEREVLLQEVHHRVKNNLQVISSLISMQMRKMSGASARNALNECKARVRAIALIHEKLYQSKNYASVPFTEYARSLCANVFDAMGISAASIALQVDIDAVSMVVDRAIPCGLILNELITNALKHAFPADRSGNLRVELRKLDTSILLTVSDDGIGMRPDFDPAKSTSLGMQLVITLVAQLDGQLEIVRDAGTAFRITFPLHAES
jgi:two-component sensor histidine kinase